jgi:hypothetical protein
MGQYEKAESLLIEAKEIWGKVLGKRKPPFLAPLSLTKNKRKITESVK